ncbi:MAG TPA: cohesin domain-containing protein, partial [Dehalococcoidia bacterium]|nr:cohesin domain-containing protein [Dehalococcoidia bacterium]
MHGSTPGLVEFISMDVDPTATPANTRSSLGSREACGSVSPGEVFTVDLTLDEVDVSDGIVLVRVFVRYNPAVLRVIDAQGYGLMLDPVLFIKDNMPDSDGRIFLEAVDAAIPDYGSGVWAKLTLEAVGPGGSQLSYVTVPSQAPYLADGNGQPLPVIAPQHAAIGVDHPDPCGDDDGDGILNAGDGCPVAESQDPDGDGLSNSCDMDDDDDGLSDASEVGPPTGSDPLEADSDFDHTDDTTDTCPLTPTAGTGAQADLDADAIPGRQPLALSPLGNAFGGDVCDADDDGDRVTDVDEVACGGDAMNLDLRPERLDGVFAGVDDDGDTMADDPLPAGAENYDCDGDGYKGNIESGMPLCGDGRNEDNADDAVVDDGCPGGPPQEGTYSEAQFNIGTIDLDPCGMTGWPSELASGGIPDSTNRANVLDMTSFLAPLRRLGASPGDAAYNQRWDLAPGRGLFA